MSLDRNPGGCGAQTSPSAISVARDQLFGEARELSLRVVRLCCGVGYLA
jgi:hypothetical protein